MIVLRENKAPVTRDLGDGISITIRRLDAFELELAAEAARKLLLARAEQEDALAAFNLPGWAPDDPDRRAYIGRVVSATEIAMRGVIALEGLSLDPDGVEPAPIDRATLSTLLREPGFYRVIVDGCEEASRILDREKKNSAPSGPGFSAPAAGPPIAPDAPGSESVAPRPA